MLCNQKGKVVLKRLSRPPEKQLRLTYCNPCALTLGRTERCPWTSIHSKWPFSCFRCWWCPTYWRSSQDLTSVPGIQKEHILDVRKIRQTIGLSIRQSLFSWGQLACFMGRAKFLVWRYSMCLNVVVRGSGSTRSKCHPVGVDERDSRTTRTTGWRRESIGNYNIYKTSPKINGQQGIRTRESIAVLL